MAAVRESSGSCVSLASSLPQGDPSRLALVDSFPHLMRDCSRPAQRRRRERAAFATSLALVLASFAWITYCTARYLIAHRVYRGDAFRARFALGMGIISALCAASYALDAALLLRARPALATPVKRVSTYVTALAVLTLAALNLALVVRWRRPSAGDPARAVQGRCTWDVDVVWSGTGEGCASGSAVPFGAWLGAAIARLVVTAIVTMAYVLALEHMRHARRSDARSAPPEMRGRSLPSGRASLAPSRPSASSSTRLAPVPSHASSSSSGTTKHAYAPESVSFASAGHVLSRARLSSDSASSRSSASTADPAPAPAPLTPVHMHYVRRRDVVPPPPPPQPQPPPTSFRPIARPSSDLQDFASAFRTLVARVTREAEDAALPPSTSEPSYVSEPSSYASEPPYASEPALYASEPSSYSSSSSSPTLEDGEHVPERVQMMGGYITRMSTIESRASRERSPSPRAPTPCVVAGGGGGGEGSVTWTGSGSSSGTGTSSASASASRAPRRSASARKI